MLKIATWNVNGIRAREQELLAFVAQENPDFLCLQEIKASPDKVPASISDLTGYHCYWHGYKGYSGVSLHVSKRLVPERPQFAHPEFDHETRIVTARVGAFLIASIYVPNGGKDFDAKVRFLDALERFVANARAEGTPLVLCGDLNVAREDRDVHPSLHKPNQTGRTPEEQAQLARILDHGLTDLSRHFAPDDDRLFSWWAPWRNMKQKNVGWRIDYVLTTPDLTSAAVSCAVQREFGTSDHGPLVAQFALDLPEYEETPDVAAMSDAPRQLTLL